MFTGERSGYQIMDSKIVILALCSLSLVYADGTSHTAVSKPEEGKYNYGIEHGHHGHWSGSAYPNGYGGLGDGHGNYGLGGAHALGVLPQVGIGHGGHGSYNGYGGYNNGLGYNSIGAGFRGGYNNGLGYNGIGTGFGGHHHRSGLGFGGYHGTPGYNSALGYNGAAGYNGGVGYNGYQGGFNGLGHHGASSYSNYNQHSRGGYY